MDDSYIESVELDSVGRSYDVCYLAMVLYAVSMVVVVIGYVGCAWPFLFIEENDTNVNMFGRIMMGIFPVLIIGMFFYLDVRRSRGHIRISIDEIEYKRYKDFTVKVSDIKAIQYFGMSLYQIHFKDKRKNPFNIDLKGFYKGKEMCILMEQLRGYLVKVSGRDKSFSRRPVFLRVEKILGKYFPAFFLSLIALQLVYTSYCCIDYDFFKKEYTASFNALGSDPNQSENAWPYYIQAAASYKESEEDFKEIVGESLKFGQLNLTDNQKANLQKWFDDNTSSWASLKKAASINYCNATYENISMVPYLDDTNRNDFSRPSDSGYDHIQYLYRNANACRLAGMLDSGWFDLFQMQVTTSKHFVSGKMFIDQLVGYAMLTKSTKLFAKQNEYQPHDLDKARQILREYFPSGIPSLSIEGEILMLCGTFDDMINYVKLPVQTPLNPMFLVFGSSTGTETYVRKRYTAILEQARKGIEIEAKSFSKIGFPIMRKMLFGILEGGTARVYKIPQRVNTNLLATYVLLDLEEYNIIKGSYPTEVSQLREAGLTSQLPDDPDSDGKILYFNDGQRAILYAVGKNGIDDGGYKDDKASDKKRDDIIYWERKLEE
ncbi:MAG: hypothetical protein ACYSWP_19660 [Planctomycetota bacterium]